MRIDTVPNSRIKECLRAAARADALICPEEHLRCYEFHSDWGEGIQMAKYSSSGADDLVIVFVGSAAIIKGFDHESEVSPHAQEPYGLFPGIYEGAPERLLNELKDDALDFEDVTFCYWRTTDTGEWCQGPLQLRGLDDGSEYLLPRILVSFDDYDGYARDYFEVDYTPELSDRIRALFPK
jgi:hypothetical protein